MRLPDYRWRKKKDTGENPKVLIVNVTGATVDEFGVMDPASVHFDQQVVDASDLTMLPEDEQRLVPESLAIR